jgi:chitin disaccharide deacetylase
VDDVSLGTDQRTRGRALAARDRGYMALDEDAVVARAKPAEIDRELRAQVDFAKAAGVHITHLDSHMATLFHTKEFFDVYRKIGADYGLPVLLERLGPRGGERSAWETGAAAAALVDRVISINPGVSAADWETAYEKMLAPLPPGVYQLIVHLGYDDDEMRGATADHPNWGAAWRQQDLETVKSAKFQAFLKDQRFIPIRWSRLATVR